MPKFEDALPWAATQAAKREPYPRKNVYFVGDALEEVYDYCVWRAVVSGYKTLDGSPARGSSELIADVLRRLYLKEMLDERLAEDFISWRQAEYEKTDPNLKMAALHLSRPGTDTSGFAPVRLRGRSKRKNEQIFAMWQRQSGKCAACGRRRILQLHKMLSDKNDSPDKFDTGNWADVISKRDARSESAEVSLICATCKRSLHLRREQNDETKITR